MKKNKKRKYKVKVKDYIFNILYVVEFLGAALIGFFGNSFFAYETFNSLWANILYLFFVSSLFVTAFVEEVCESHAVGDVITNFAVFILGMVMFLLFFIFDGVFAMLTLLFSAIMFVVTGCRYALILRKDENTQPDPKRIIAVAALLLFSMIRQLSVKYVNDKIWSLALIPAVIIFVVAIAVTFVLVRKIWTKMYPTTGESVGNAIVAVLMLFFLSYMFSVTAISVANCVFDDEPTPVECVVLEKHVLSGTHTVTQFEVRISVDEKDRWINVPVTEYHDISVGDTIIIDYYYGAFNLPYYVYSEKG